MTSRSVRRFVWIALAVALGVAVMLSPFASRYPDGLERVAEDKGFLEKGESPAAFQAPAPDYTIPGVQREWLSTSLAGALGTLMCFGLGGGVAVFLRRRRGRS